MGRSFPAALAVHILYTVLSGHAGGVFKIPRGEFDIAACGVVRGKATIWLDSSGWLPGTRDFNEHNYSTAQSKHK